MLKASVVITVKNEKDSIGKLITRLLQATDHLKEIIIVDSGSKDGTIGIIKELQKKSGLLKLIIKPGINRSRGRNLGIRYAKSEIIAVTDAGCYPSKKWLSKIINPFREAKVDVVSGWYKPAGKSVFQKSLAVYTCVLPHNLNPGTYLPSSRSLAFRKSAWKKVGGYPEGLATCEDLVFAQMLKQANLRFVLEKEAVVYWPQKKRIFSAFKQLYGYAQGDGQARYKPHLKHAYRVWCKYLIALLFWFTFPPLLLFFLMQYLGWVIGKGYCYIKDKRAIFYLPLIQLVADLAVMSGSLSGIILGHKKGRG